jgi:hypothetical protein
MKIAVTIAVALACLTPRVALAHPHHGCQAAARRLYAHLPPDLPPQAPTPYAERFTPGTANYELALKVDAQNQATYRAAMTAYKPTGTRDWMVATCGDRMPVHGGRTVTITVEHQQVYKEIP